MAVQWYLKQGDESVGPFNSSELKRMGDAGEVQPSDLVQKGEEGQWVSASKVQGLFEQETSPSGPPPRKEFLANEFDFDSEGRASDKGESENVENLEQISKTNSGFGFYLSQHFSKSRLPHIVGIILGFSLSIAASWMKPTIGSRGIWGLTLALSVLVVMLFSVFLGQHVFAYYSLGTRSIPIRAKNSFARIGSIGFTCLLFLLPLAVLESFAPETGLVRTSVALVGGQGFSGTGLTARNAEQAKQHLIETTKKYDGDFARAVVAYVDAIESGRWSWGMADKEMIKGPFTAETKQAYRDWRKAKVAETE